MDAQNITHQDVQTALHRDEQNGRYYFGVVLHGEFIPLVEHKLGRIDKWILRGKERRAQQQPKQSADPQQQPQQ